MTFSTFLAVSATSVTLGMMGDHAALFQGRIEPEFNSGAWSAHPFWSDEEFHEGTVCYDGNLYTQVWLRYNIFENELVVLTPKTKLPVIPNQEKIEFFTMGDTRFVRRDGRFMAVVFDGNNFMLLHCAIKSRGLEHEVEGRMVRTMDLADLYYVEDKAGDRYEVRKARSFEKLYPKYKRPLRKYRRSLDFYAWEDPKTSSILVCGAELDRIFDPADAPLQTKEEEVRPGSQLVYLSPQVEDSLWVAQVPDSVFRDIARVDRVPAYLAYRMGNRVQLEYDDDDELTGEPGVEELRVLRESKTLEEVEVTAFRPKMLQAHSGMEAFTPKSLHNVPLVMGEADVLKLATMLPGVTTTGEASSGLNVRGGASEQNLMLYNSNTIFNPMHLFGIFSAFNPDLVGESEIYKGGIPSQYGGRLSSVMNIKGRIPDMQKYSGSVSIGVVSAKAMAELPIVKNRVSVLLGGRSTYSDWLLKKLPEKSGYKDGRAQFWDAGGTVHVRLNNRHSLDVNSYLSHDQFSFTAYDEYAYNNMNYSVELKSHYDDQWSSYWAAGYDHYGYENTEKESPSMAAVLSFDLNHYYVKGIAEYVWNDSHSLNAGVQGQFYDIQPGSYQPLNAQSFIVGRKLQTDNAFESALWLEDEWRLSDDLKMTGGLRLNLFNARKENLESFYANPDLRLSTSYQLSETRSVKAGFNTMHQCIHKVSNTMIMSPTDSWMLSNEKIKPQHGWQASVGYYVQSKNMDYEFSIEGYFKGMKEYLTYRNAAQLSMNDHLEKDVVGMDGRAYGVEVQIRKLTGKLTGWLSYTYSRALLQQKKELGGDKINGGDWYSTEYDCPHDIKLVANYKFTRRYSMSLNMNYSTGRPYTAPVGVFYNSNEGLYVPVYSKRNGVRMPDYFRTDWSFNVEPSHHLTDFTHRWFSMGVYNLFGRKNPYSIYVKSENNEIKAYKLSIFGAPIPYVSYNIKF